jgi:signal transduction histidine kinase/predicted RNA-binding protein with RPS1 domain
MSQNSLYTTGQQVVGKVERVLPYGLFVRLEDGASAYIRRRELTWASNVDPRALWQEGQAITGVVLKLANLDHSMELSHRRTLPDPWNEFTGKFQQGDVVEARVKSLMSYGVYAEIIPGVDGLIPLAELATWKVQKAEDIVWVGDVVAAVITQLDFRTRKLKLSIRARIHQLEVVAGIMKDFSLFSQVETTSGEFDEGTEAWPETEMELLKAKQVKSILVVDDYETIRSSLVTWLRHRGHEVDEAGDAAEAHEKILKKSYDLLLVDLNLSGLDGLALLRRLSQKGIPYQAAVMSTAEWLAERSREIEELGVAEAFIKPLDLVEIEHLLTRIEQREGAPRRPMTSRPAQTKIPKSFQQLITIGQTKASLAEQFREGLKQLIATTAAETGFIFRLDPISRSVSITSQVGEADFHEEALHSLEASPVRDVIEEGEEILENRMVGQVKERFRKLLDLLPFESCIGTPIEAGGETHRALFLFHRKANVFNRYHLRDTVATSLLFSVAIERQAMEHRLSSLNKLLLSGQLASGFSHEVYNKMSGLEIQLRNLQMDCRLFEQQSDQSTSFEEIRQATDRLMLTFEDLKNTVEVFQQLMRADETHYTPIHQIIQKAVSLLRPTLRKHSVRIETDLSPGLPGVMVNATQLEQVFLNLMLNALQHMSLKPGQGKVMTIATSYQAHDGGLPLKIRFSDTGPGIHQRLWEKIFELGFTTRLGGTGQGLYIARSLVEALGGKVRVERSVIPIGTTFLVELPEI